MTNTEKNYFTFNGFDELRKGDVFKFEKALDSDLDSVFFTCYHKDENITKVSSTYGKKMIRLTLKNETIRLINIFPVRFRGLR